METYTLLSKIQKEYILHYKKYTYPKEKIREYTRNYYLKNKEKRKVKVGLMDYEKVEILSGISVNDELVKSIQ